MTQNTLDPMAATSDNQDVRDFTNKDSLDQRTNGYSTKPLLDNVPRPRRKSTFKITSIKMSDDGDSMDDLDEGHTERTDDYSSDILELSCGEETPSASEDMPYLFRISGQDGGTEKADLHSRFRVVKIDTKEPFKRGRWTCHDSVSVEKSDTKVLQDDVNSESSSTCSSKYFQSDVDDIAKSSLQACDSMRVQTKEDKLSGLFAGFQPIHPTVNIAVHQPLILNCPINQVSSLDHGSNFTQFFPEGYTSGVSQSHGQSNPSSCQMANKSMSFHSINSINPNDNSAQQRTYIVTSSPQIGDISSGSLQNCSNQVINGALDVNTSNIPPILMSQFPIGQQKMSDSFPSSVHMSIDGNPSVIPTQNQVSSSSTFQNYIHLGDQQIVNPVISKIDHNETVHSVGDIGVSKTATNQSMLGATVNQTVDESQSNCDKDSGDQDNTLMPNSETLSPVSVAAIIDIQEDEKSGSSFVAIDNKIEQAMDLVKSHLMFAVREEVEVLKEQISELVERNNHLEHENGILRAAANEETLARLALEYQQQLPSSSLS